MGATASTQVASNFFMGSKQESTVTAPPPVSHPEAAPIHTDVDNKFSKTVSEAGVKLLPGGDSVSPHKECPMHQIGDGKGVAGKLRIIDTVAKDTKMKLQKEIITPQDLYKHSNKENAPPSSGVDLSSVNKDKEVPSPTKSSSLGSQCPMHKEKPAEEKPILSPRVKKLSENVKEVILPRENSPVFGQTMKSVNPSASASATAASKILPSECPMSQAEETKKAPSPTLYPSECPMSQGEQAKKPPSPAAYPSACPMSQGEDKAKALIEDLNTDNMVRLEVIERLLRGI